MTLQELPTKSLDLWTPGEDLILKERVAEGISFILIACELGRSRGACIGRADRLDLHHPNQRKRSYHEPHVIAPQYTLPVSVKEPVPADVNLKPLLELKFNECKYPYGEPAAGESFLFCGAPRTHKSYCAFHHNLTHYACMVRSKEVY